MRPRLPDPTAQLLELRILSGGPHGVRIKAKVQARLINEMRAQTDLPAHELDSTTLAAVLIAAEQEDRLERHNLRNSAKVALWIPRARELLFEVVRELQDKLYRKGL